MYHELHILLSLLIGYDNLKPTLMLPLFARSLPYFTEIIQPNLKYIFGTALTATTTAIGFNTFNEVLKTVSLIVSLLVGFYTLRKLIREERIQKIKRKGETNA